MKNKKLKLILSSILVILPIFIGLILWDKLPDQIVTHWSFNGTPDGWSSKTFTVLVLPLILLAIHLFCLFITFLDPKNENQSNNIFDLVIWITPITSLFANGAIYLNTLNIHLPMQIFGSAFAGLIFIVIGLYFPKCKQNYTIGIKLPWTLNDENNWNATHKFASKFWIIGGILMLLTGLLPIEAFMWVFFGIILLLTIIPSVYSFVYYIKHK